jgi:serine/threonine protein kinase
MIGKTLNERYTLTQSLGRGGMGEVFLAVDSWQYNQQVAIKALSPQLAQDESYLHRFRMEAGILKRLNHPNIVEYIEDFAIEGQHFIVMEYVEGGNLLDFISVSGPLSQETFRKITLALTDALTRAHDNSIVHRDIKPENILLTAEGVPKLSDFGVAWLLGQPMSTANPRFGGSPYYMSPQRWEGANARQVDDIWSLGVVMFEMLAGTVPFDGPTEMATIHAIWQNPTPDLRELRPDLPHGYAAIIERCLEKSPSQRYQMMRKLAADLEEGAPENGTKRQDGLFRGRTRRRPLYMALAIIVTLITGGIILSQFGQNSDPNAAVIAPSRTPQPSATTYIVTATPQDSPVPQNTPSPAPTTTLFVVTSTQEPSNTPVDTNTPTDTPTWTPTATATGTSTPAPVNTTTTTPSITSTSTAMPTSTATSTLTLTPTAMATNTATFTPTITNTPRPTLTPSNTPTSTPDLLATQQAIALATLARLATDTAPTATLTASPTPSPSPIPGAVRWPASMRALDDFSEDITRWEIPAGWQVATVENNNSVLVAEAPGAARRLDAADWGRHFSLRFRFRFEQQGVFSVDLFGDLTRCQAAYFEVSESGIAIRYNNRAPVAGTCPRDDIRITELQEPISGFVWHTLRLEARDDIMIVHLDGVRLSVVRNPLPSNIGPSGIISLPGNAETAVWFDDFVINTLNPSDARDLVWTSGDAYCVQDFAAGTESAAIEAAIEGEYVDAIWAVGPSDVAEQSYMLYPFPGNILYGDNVRRYAYYGPNDTLVSGTYSLIPLHGDVEVTSRRLNSPNRGGYQLPDAPRNIQATLTDQGIQLTWNPVAPMEGVFNPGGSYLIRIHPIDANLFTRLFRPLYEDRGASSVPRYVIPWGRLYRPPTARGILLEDLPDGTYLIDIWAVSGRPSSGDECRAIDFRETLQMTINVGRVLIIHPNGTIISGPLNSGG